VCRGKGDSVAKGKKGGSFAERGVREEGRSISLERKEGGKGEGTSLLSGRCICNRKRKSKKCYLLRETERKKGVLSLLSREKKRRGFSCAQYVLKGKKKKKKTRSRNR